ncbi:MAG: PASTA domain-containing protein [Bacteroidetes bacterium]|nr:PASTA domain-containing protein [Bacteroidota bacterium]
MKLIKFIFTKYFWVSLLMMVLVALIFFLGMMGYLRSYTDHNKSITVPDLTSMSLEEVENVLKIKKLRYEILDSSSYYPDLAPRAVITHSPAAGQKVKEKRKIYLEVNRTTPPLVKFPAWKEYPQRKTVIDKIRSLGFKVGREVRVSCAHTDYVMDLKFEGEGIEEGTLIPKGSAIDIHLCDGFGNTRLLIPDLFGKSLLEAKLILEAYSLVLGRVETDGSVKDSLASFVYYQSPPHDGASTIRMGEAVDVYVTENQPTVQ